MTRQFETAKYLKTRYLISCDQMNAEQKIAELKNLKLFSRKRLKQFLRRFFKKEGKSIHKRVNNQKNDIF